MADGPAHDWFCYMERQKSSVRSKVEHAFHIIKNTFGISKVCYRGIAKNLNRLYMLAAIANLLMCAQSGGWRKQTA
jgi:IS5 family transposase